MACCQLLARTNDDPVPGRRIVYECSDRSYPVAVGSDWVAGWCRRLLACGHKAILRCPTLLMPTSLRGNRTCTFLLFRHCMG